MSRTTTTTPARSRGAHRPPRRRAGGRRFLGILAGFGLAMTVTATSAVALLNAVAYNGTGQPVTSAKLSLSLTDNGAGFTQAVSALVPTDTVNRFVDVTNNGTADGTNLVLGIAAGTTNKLVTDAVNGLQISIASCSGGWTASTGACSGSTTSLVTSTPLSGLTGTTQTVVNGAFAQGAVQHLRVTLALPAQSETTVNGTPPANTIQGLSTTITYTFAIGQRAGVPTTS
jgi:hypothetical protein